MTQKNSSPIFDPALHIDPRVLLQGDAELSMVFPEKTYSSEGGVELEGDLAVQVSTISSEHKGMWLEIKYQGAQKLECSRSLEKFKSPLNHRFQVYLRWDESVKLSKLSEEEEDYWIFVVNPQGHRLEIDEVVRQEILLQEPLHPVKNPEESFKWKDEGLGEDESEKIDPRWAKLKELSAKNAKKK